jgi:hypothetical protein
MFSNIFLLAISSKAGAKIWTLFLPSKYFYDFFLIFFEIFFISLIISGEKNEFFLKNFWRYVQNNEN